MRGKTYSILLFAGILASLLPNVAIAGSREYINDWVYEASGAATCVAVSSNGSYIAVGTPYGLYLLDSDKNLLWNHQTDYPIIDISMTADASKIVAGGSSGYFGGGMAYFFNLAGDPKGTTKANHGLSSVSLSPEGDYFAITYDNGLGIADE